VRSVLIIACFFASGAAGLILEIAWIRRCALSFGSTAAAVSTVLAVFFGGLALGSWLLGRRAQRSPRPLRLDAMVELALAAATVLSLLALGAADAAYGGAYRALAGHPALLGAVRVALVALAILPATVLMGGTLPIMSRAFVVASTRSR
jgi:spermidine synthase